MNANPTPLAALDSAARAALHGYLGAALTAIDLMTADPASIPAVRRALRERRLVWRELDRAAAVAHRHSILGYVFGGEG